MTGKRRIGAALSCLLFLFVCAGCVTGAQTDKTEKFQTKDLIGAQGALVSMAAEGEKTDRAGILIDGQENFTGHFNAEFEGNTALSFGFCKGERSTHRRFTLTVTFDTQPMQSFCVVYESTAEDWTGEESGRGRSGAYVRYGEEARTSRYWQSDKHATDADAWQNNDNFDVDEALASPMFGGAGEYETEFGALYGTLYLEWTADGILQIKVSDRFPEEYSPRLIAAFDGSEAGLGYDPVIGTWGLPRLDASAKYTISFRSEVFGGAQAQSDAPGIYFSEIVTGPRGQEKTVSLAEKEMANAPAFYVAQAGRAL